MPGRQQLDQPYGTNLEESSRLCMYQSIADLLYDNDTRTQTTCSPKTVSIHIPLCRMCLESSLSPPSTPIIPIPSPAAILLSNPHHQSISQSANKNPPFSFNAKISPIPIPCYLIPSSHHLVWSHYIGGYGRFTRSLQPQQPPQPPCGR